MQLGQPCQYRSQTESTPHREGQATVSPTASGNSQRCRSLEYEQTLEPKQQAQEPLEFALLHYFLTETISVFHDRIALWKTRIPLVGLKHRFVLDAMLSLVALDLYRHTFESHTLGTREQTHGCG